MGTYDNHYNEGHDIYLCIFTDRAKDDRYAAESIDKERVMEIIKRVHLQELRPLSLEL